MDVAAIHSELASSTAAFGPEVRLLGIGRDALRLSGMDPGLVDILERRFGSFLRRDDPALPAYELRLVRSSRKQWLVQAEAGELYRFESVGPAGRRVVVSYHFALGPDAGASASRGSEAGRHWRVAIAEGSPEPLGRIVDNAARFLAARAAIDRGGFAMHGAGVLRDGRAQVFAGPSRSGKSTAVRLSRPARSLGDDFAVVLPTQSGWCVPALPFDNAERIDAPPPVETAPLGTIWRLFQAPAHAVERPSGLSAITSLLGCVAFPWAVPEAADALLSRAAAIIEAGHFAHLHFRRDPGFWSLMV